MRDSHNQRLAASWETTLGARVIALAGRELERRGIVDDYMQGSVYDVIARELTQSVMKDPKVQAAILQALNGPIRQFIIDGY